MVCTASQLIDKLAGSGTGATKIATFRAALEANPKASAHDLIAACEGKVPSGTMAKALAFAGPASQPEKAEAPQPEKAEKPSKGKADAKDTEPAAAGAKN